MTDDIMLIELRNEALRKIGRNMVNFQKMEAMLKFLGERMTVSTSRHCMNFIVKLLKAFLPTPL